MGFSKGCSLRVPRMCTPSATCPLPLCRRRRGAAEGRPPLMLPLPTVSQHAGVLTNHLGTSASSPTSESDNHALLDEKEDSYFSEIRNFIANSEMNQASTRTDKR